MNPRPVPTWWIISAIIVLCTALLTINLTQPWVGFHATAGVKRSVEAENYIRYGILNLKFGQCNNFEPVTDPAKRHFYQHHPPLTSLLMVPGFRLLGVSGFSARFPFILITLASLLVFYHLAARCYGQRVALMATFIFSVMPVTTFYGRSPNYEPVTQLFILLSVLAYLRWLDDPRGKHFLSFVAVYLCALFSDWPSFFLAGLIPLHYLLTQKSVSGQGRVMILVPAVTIAAFALFLTNIYLVDPGSLANLWRQLEIHSGLAGGHMTANAHVSGELTVQIEPRLFVLRLVDRFLSLFLFPAIILALFGLLFVVSELRHRTRTRGNLLVVLLLLLAVLYCAVFYKSTYIHYFWVYYFGAPIALLAAVGADRLVCQGGIDGAHTRIAVLFLVLLIGLPGLWNLRALHSLQRKVLPGDQHESVTLIKAIGRQVREMTSPDDLILTNLHLTHRGLKGGEMVEYYAQRKMRGEIGTPAAVATVLREARESEVYFYYWQGRKQDDGRESDLMAYLSTRFPYQQLSVEEYAFDLYRLR